MSPYVRATRPLWFGWSGFTRGECKITDCGTCNLLQETLEQAASWVGTVCYMSPERIQGGNYDRSSDIWSLGITAVEMATGRYPYESAAEAPLLGASLSFTPALFSFPLCPSVALF